jgi:hypothetical protein
MSRRHNSSRRRSYARRQHEVRERRPEMGAAPDGQTLIDTDTFDSGDELDFPMDSAPPRARDRMSGAHP